MLYFFVLVVVGIKELRDFYNYIFDKRGENTIQMKKEKQCFVIFNIINNYNNGVILQYYIVRVDRGKNYKGNMRNNDRYIFIVFLGIFLDWELCYI